MSGFTQTIELANAVVEYRDLGSSSRPPLVFIHGCPSDYQDLSTSAQRLLEAHFRVITYMRPGFGRSHSKIGAGSISQHADTLASLLKHLEIDSPVLLAHSMGARIAIDYLNRYGSNDTSAVLLSPYLYPASTAQSRRIILRALRLPMLGDFLLSAIAKFVGRPSVEKNLIESSHPRPTDLDRIQDATFRYSLPQTILAIMEEQEALLVSETPRLLNASRAIMIAGSLDRIAPSRDHAQRFVEENPGAQIFIDESIGHLLSHISGATLKRVLDQLQLTEGDQNAAAQGL